MVGKRTAATYGEVGGGVEVTDRDVAKVLEEVVGELTDLARPSCREPAEEERRQRAVGREKVTADVHERLTVGADLVDDLADLRLEPHVEHLRDIAEVSFLLAELGRSDDSRGRPHP